MACVNLLNRFGNDYRMSYDPAYDAKGRHRDNLDPWMMQLPCQRGTIYPHGGSTLAVEVDYRPQTARRLAELPGVRLHQDGDGEKTFLFDVADFPAVAAIVLPRKRRKCHLTDAQLANLSVIGQQALAKRRATANGITGSQAP